LGCIYHWEEGGTRDQKKTRRKERRMELPDKVIKPKRKMDTRKVRKGRGYKEKSIPDEFARNIVWGGGLERE